MNARCLILISTLLVGCASEPEVPGEVLATRAATARVDIGLETAGEESESLNLYEVPVRYNPAERCACPDFEVHVYGGWQRVYIVAPTTVQERLDDFSKDPDQIAELAVNGRMTTTKRLAETGVSFPVFEVEEP